jgi:hypothetical protein
LNDTLVFQSAYFSLFLFGCDGQSGRETARTAQADRQPQMKIEGTHTGLRQTLSHELLEMAKL